MSIHEHKMERLGVAPLSGSRPLARGCEVEPVGAVEIGGSRAFWAAKRVFDVVGALLLLMVTVATGLVLLVLNPLLNPGPLLVRQRRMGWHRRPVEVIKFRTMLPSAAGVREASGAVEHHRVTPLGSFLRRTRIDELPQVLNVLRGEMSLIGPRPDLWEHAQYFCEVVPGYRERHVVRPGISGLAQVTEGYAEDLEEVRRKVARDHQYICNA